IPARRRTPRLSRTAPARGTGGLCKSTVVVIFCSRITVLDDPHYAAGDKPSSLATKSFACLADNALRRLASGNLCPRKLYDELTPSSELLLYSLGSVSIVFGYIAGHRCAGFRIDPKGFRSRVFGNAQPTPTERHSTIVRSQPSRTQLQRDSLDRGKTSGDYHLLFFGVNILNAVCFEAIILVGPRQSGFLTIFDKPQPDEARRHPEYGKARNRKIEAYPDGSPRTPTDPAIHAGSEENRFDRCHRGAKQRRPHSGGKSCLIRSDRLSD